MGDRELKQRLLEQVAETHAVFCGLMESKLEEVTAEDIERYFALLSGLVVRLEDGSKSLREVFQETAIEVAPIIMAELAG